MTFRIDQILVHRQLQEMERHPTHPATRVGMAWPVMLVLTMATAGLCSEVPPDTELEVHVLIKHNETSLAILDRR